MDRVNPVYIPRNHLVEEALAAATADDLGPLPYLLLAVITAPFDERDGLERYGGARAGAIRSNTGPFARDSQGERRTNAVARNTLR